MPIPDQVRYHAQRRLYVVEEAGVRDAELSTYLPRYVGRYVGKFWIEEKVERRRKLEESLEDGTKVEREMEGGRARGSTMRATR